MFDRLRIELTMIVTLAVAVTAVVLAIQDEGSPAATAVERTTTSPDPVFVREFQPKGHTIAIQDFVYDPDPVRVQAGQAVVWENYDNAAHTVTAEDGSWDSGALARGEAVVAIFDEPGTYTYICTFHPPALSSRAPFGEPLVSGGGGLPMQGTVIVE